MKSKIIEIISHGISVVKLFIFNFVIVCSLQCDVNLFICIVLKQLHTVFYLIGGFL